MKDLSELEFRELLRLSMYSAGESGAKLEKRLYMIQLILMGDMYQIITDENGNNYRLGGSTS